MIITLNFVILNPFRTIFLDHIPESGCRVSVTERAKSLYSRSSTFFLKGPLTDDTYLIRCIFGRS